MLDSVVFIKAIHGLFALSITRGVVLELLLDLLGVGSRMTAGRVEDLRLSWLARRPFLRRSAIFIFHHIGMQVLLVKLSMLLV